MQHLEVRAFASIPRKESHASEWLIFLKKIGRSIGFALMKRFLVAFLAKFINLIENSSFPSLPNKVANVANI